MGSKCQQSSTAEWINFSMENRRSSPGRTPIGNPTPPEPAWKFVEQQRSKEAHREQGWAPLPMTDYNERTGQWGTPAARTSPPSTSYPLVPTVYQSPSRERLDSRYGIPSVPDFYQETKAPRWTGTFQTFVFERIPYLRISAALLFFISAVFAAVIAATMIQHAIERKREAPPAVSAKSLMDDIGAWDRR